MAVSAYHAQRKIWLRNLPETSDFVSFLRRHRFRMCLVSSGIEKKQWFKIVPLGISDYFVLRSNEGRVTRELVYYPRQAGRDGKHPLRRVVSSASP